MALAKVGWTSILVVLAFAVRNVFGQTSIAVPRWGQASAILYDKLLISGGKIDPQHQFTYTSAPNCNDLLTLDLSTTFSLSSPPWAYISGSQNSSSSQGPAVAFHTLTPYTSTELLLFGGNSGFSAIQSNADSAWLLNVQNLMSPSWSSQAAGWASQPMRRVYHAASSASGAIYILGGQKADGSQIDFPDSYIFNAVADSGSPAFIPLRSTINAPPGLFGHAAHVLPGGTLLVFGGFFSSGSTPNTPSPLSTIYTLDTTSASPTWSIQNATGGTIPFPRRGFASVLLNDGKILIHGGADAAIQTLYSDAAILDTTQTPMTWSPVDGLSDTLGPRVGHFAALIHNQVLFGFGWAGNAAASTGIALYDPSSGTFHPTYTPPSTPTPVSITTLPVSPTSPGGTYPFSGTNTGQGDSAGPGSSTLSGIGSSPSGSGGSQGGDGSSGQNGSNKRQSNAGVVAGSVLGFFAFIVLAGGGVYYVLRQRERRTRGFDYNIPTNLESLWRRVPEEDPWDATLEDSPTVPGTMVQMAGTRWHDQSRRGWGIPGLGALIGIGSAYRTTGRRRLDMLADEDARQFDIGSVAHDGEGDSWSYIDEKSRRGTRRQGTGGSSISADGRSMNVRRSSWNNIWNASVTSLRNAGVPFGVMSTPTAAHKSVVASLSYPEWREKDELLVDLFKDPPPGRSAPIEITPLVDTVDNSRLRDGESASKSIATPKQYVDPFADPYEGEITVGHVGTGDTTNLLGNAHDYTAGASAGAQSSQSSLPRSLAMVGLARAGRASPGSPDRDRGTSVESHDALSSEATQTSHTGTGVNSSSTDPRSSVSSLLSPRTTSIVGSITTPNVPMRRSDSWWSRFSRTSFLDRHSTQDPSHRSAGIGGLVDFRDPNPPPRLGAIQESTPPSRQGSEDANIPSTSMSGGGAGKVAARKTGSGYAVSTKSSVKTANSELIEGMDGRMEVVQRAMSMTSRGTASPSTSDSYDDFHRWGSSSTEPSANDTHRRSWTTSDVDPGLPVAESPTVYFGDGSPLTGVSVSPTFDPSTSSLSAGAQERPRPPRRALTGAVAARVSAYERRLSQDSFTISPPPDAKPRLKNERSRRGGVGYGLVPKAPLFVANPDRRNLSEST